MVVLVKNASHWASFNMKWAKEVVLKAMNAVEELEDLTTSLSLSSTEIGENICKNVAKI